MSIRLVGKMIHWELYKKFRLDHTNIWYILNTDFILQNKSHKIIWDLKKHATTNCNKKQKRVSAKW